MIRLDEAVNRGFQQKPRHGYLRAVPQVARPVLSDLPSRYITYLCSSSFCLNNFTGIPFDGFPRRVLVARQLASSVQCHHSSGRNGR
jgi:hypothetical protein